MPDQDELTADDFPNTRESLAVRGELRAPEFHPSTAAFLKRLARHGGLSDSVSVGYARRRFGSMTPLIATFPSVASVTDRNVAGPHGRIPVRMVYPHGVEVPRPVIVWFPGGGFVLGDLETGEPTARHLAMRTGAIVVCVNYRKAPEHRLDDAFDDAVAVVRWVHANAASLGVDPELITVGGDSAGGNIAAVVAQEILADPDTNIDLALQMLVYPSVSVEYEPARSRDQGDAPLDNTAMIWFESHVSASVDPRSRRYYPLTSENVSALPPAVVVTAGFDPLRDEGIAYVDRLRQEGVRAEHLHYADDIHGFMTMDLMLDNATSALDSIGDHFREILEIDNSFLPDGGRPDSPFEQRVDGLRRRGKVLASEVVERVSYRWIRSQRTSLALLGMPSARDIDRVNSQVSRLEAQVRSLRSQLANKDRAEREDLAKNTQSDSRVS